MVHFMIASHGYLADGFKSSLAIILGNEILENIQSVNAFVDEDNENAKHKIEEMIESYPENEQVIVFTDIMYGSVNQYLIPYIDDDRIFLITGMNLPLICEVVTKYSNCSKVVLHELNEIVKMARLETKLVNIEESSNDQSNFFEI